MSGPTPGRLFVVDDDATQMRALCATLEKEGYITTGFTSAKLALAHLEKHTCDLLLTDLTMPETDGIALLRAANKIDPRIVGIVMTGHGSIDTAVAAMQAGALDYILKPFSLRTMRPVLERALTVRRLLDENLELRRSGDTIQHQNVELQRTVHERTLDLTEVNRELEAFSHSVAHDLRAPLRVIIGFSQLLLDEYGAALDDRGRNYVERVVAEGARMQQLIADLMRLSHAAGVDLNRVEFDLSMLANAIVNDLREREPARRVHVRIDEHMLCWGDPQLLRIALENLIANAWKFTRDTPNAQVEIGQQTDSPSTFYVRDNGAGFEAAQAKNLFAPFRRLHTHSEFPGTGVGLSIVQRIVRRHGGRVSAQGAVGQGATFCFVVPAPTNTADALSAPHELSRGTGI